MGPGLNFPIAMEDDNRLKLIDLQDLIEKSSEYTQKQLQNIDTKHQLITSITLLISIFALLGFGVFLGILKIIGLYWIPSSFLIWFLWMIYGLITIKNFKVPEKSIDSLNYSEKNEKARENVVKDWINKILYPPMIGIFALYLITLIFLLCLRFDFIETQNIINTNIPIISTLIFLIFPFTTRFEQNNSSYIPEYTSMLLLIFAGIIAILVVFVLPLFALKDTVNLIFNFPFLESLVGFVAMIIIQIIFILLFISSISALIAEIELKNTITNLARINDEINILRLNPNQIQEDTIELLKVRYQTIKKYDVEVMYLLIFKTYSIIPNKLFLERCL